MSKEILARIKSIESQISFIKTAIKPIVLEREAIEESRTNFIISCDASEQKDKQEVTATAGVVFRSKVLLDKKTVEVARVVKAADCNEAELDAIYFGLETFSSMHIHAASNSIVEKIIIRSDSRACINWINNNKKCKSEKLDRKIKIIQDLAKATSLLLDKPVQFQWRKRNSTTDLTQANKLAQQLLGVKNR